MAKDLFGICPFVTSQKILQGKWAILVLHELSQGLGQHLFGAPHTPVFFFLLFHGSPSFLNNIGFFVDYPDGG